MVQDERTGNLCYDVKSRSFRIGEGVQKIGK